MTRLAERIATVTNGRLILNCFGPGGIVPFGETTEAVRTRTLDMAAWWTCYDLGMRPVTALWGTSPFGFNNSQDYFDWMVYFGGLDLMNECYNEWNIVVPAFCGAGAAQIAGQTKVEKRSYYDMGGYIFRSSGLAAEVLQQCGMETIFLPAAELFTAIERGVIDVVEYAGPNWNYRSAYHEVAPFAYGPGWHEPASITAALVNKEAWEELPTDIQEAFKLGCYAQYTLYGGLARHEDIWGLEQMLEYGVVWNRIPDRDLQILYDGWLEVAAKYSAEDDLFKRTIESMESFKAGLANIQAFNWDLSFERSELPLPKKLDEKADWEDLSAYIVD
jgi:TRAP-type mannitol/chloroaromatic compound transport system substrate-binding protein